MYRYTPRGVCSRAIDIDLDGDKVARVEFVGGCDGNLKAVSKLIEGMTVEEDRKSTRLNSSHIQKSRMPSSA